MSSSDDNYEEIKEVQDIESKNESYNICKYLRPPQRCDIWAKI